MPRRVKIKKAGAAGRVVEMDIETLHVDRGRMVVNRAFLPLLERNSLLSASALWNMEAEPVKNILKERGTFRAFLDSGDGEGTVEVYLKRYLPLPIREKVKNLLSLKKGFDSAFHEWEAMLAFHRHGLSTMIPVAVAGTDGQTCNLSLGIRNYVRASEFFRPGFQVSPGQRMDAVRKIAGFAGRMHGSGMAHQDFYLVHMFFDRDDYDVMNLIDLQRVVIQERLAVRWIVKDVAQFIFSASPLLSDDEMNLFYDDYIASYGKVSSGELNFGKVFEAASAKAGRIEARAKRKRAL
jgi:hypothetical protein